ncbi:MAG: HAD-IA family hydrolase [Vicinamibacterales bacterium]
MRYLHRRLIAFDLDGTLVESRRDLADSANDLIVELGGEPLAVDAIAGMVGEGAGLLVRRALDAAGLISTEGSREDDGSALRRFLEIYDTRLLNHTFVYDGIEEVVRLARSHASAAVLTNKPLAASERILAAFGLRDLFDEVIGGDGPHPRKPDPTSLVALMTRAGAGPADTLLVGDSTVDLDTARRASARCCLVTYGFGFGRAQLTSEEWTAGNAASLRRVIEEFVTG